MARKNGVIESIKELPDFCWQTYEEVLSYLEQINDVCEYHSLCSILAHAERRGMIESKWMTRTVGHINGGTTHIKLYKRVVA